MQGSPSLPSPIKRIFYMSSEGTNLHHEVGMQFSQRKRTIVTEMPYGNLNEISFSRKHLGRFIHMLNMPTPLYCKVSHIMGHYYVGSREPRKGENFSR
jgi:hypothetical protein